MRVLALLSLSEDNGVLEEVVLDVVLILSLAYLLLEVMVGLLVLIAVDEVIFFYFLNFLVEGEQLFFGRLLQQQGG